MWTKIKKDIGIILFVQAAIVILTVITYIEAHLIELPTDIIDKLPIAMLAADIIASTFCIMINHTGYLDNL